MVYTYTFTYGRHCGPHVVGVQLLCPPMARAVSHVASQSKAHSQCVHRALSATARRRKPAHARAGPPRNGDPSTAAWWATTRDAHAGAQSVRPMQGAAPLGAWFLLGRQPPLPCRGLRSAVITAVIGRHAAATCTSDISCASSHAIDSSSTWPPECKYKTLRTTFGA